MHLDENKLPQQQSGDRKNQLQRVGMIAVGEILTRQELLEVHPTEALKKFFEVEPGVYVRHPGADPRDVSADQLVPVFATWLLDGNKEGRRNFANMTKAMFRRGGFAQNTRKIIYDAESEAQEKRKVPDFLLLRVLPFLVRTSKLLSPLRYVADLFLLAAVLLHLFPLVWKDDSIIPSRKTDDDVDDNNLIITLVTCEAKWPSLISRFATDLYAKLRGYNRGCRGYDHIKLKIIENMHHPVLGALRWYHRGGNGGNPEIADLFAPVIARYILRKKEK